MHTPSLKINKNYPTIHTRTRGVCSYYAYPPLFQGSITYIQTYLKEQGVSSITILIHEVILLFHIERFFNLVYNVALNKPCIVLS